MRVRIKKYTPYFSTGAISIWLEEKVGLKEKTADSIADFLCKLGLQKTFDLINDWNQSTIAKVKIEEQDLWGLDHTLAIVIHASLLKFRELDKHGVPGRITGHETFDDDENDEKYNSKMAEWNDILDKMIFSFDAIINEDKYFDEYYVVKPDLDCGKDFIESLNDPDCRGIFDNDAYLKHEERVQEGIDLFAKYFRNLWD
jgi:hypothetical protein